MMVTIIIDRGIESIMPMNPNSALAIHITNSNINGLTPILRPIRFGVIKLESIIITTA